MLALNDWVSSEYAVGREVSAAWARAYVEAHGIIDSIGQPWLLESFGAYGSFLVKLAPTAAAKLQQALSLEQALLTWRRGCPPLQAVEAFTIALDIARWLNRPKPAAEEAALEVLEEVCGWLDSEAAQALLELIAGDQPSRTALEDA